VIFWLPYKILIHYIWTALISKTQKDRQSLCSDISCQSMLNFYLNTLRQLSHSHQSELYMYYITMQTWIPPKFFQIAPNFNRYCIHYSIIAEEFGQTSSVHDTSGRSLHQRKPICKVMLIKKFAMVCQVMNSITGGSSVNRTGIWILICMVLRLVNT
jgi:hypothetical protein